MYRTIERLAWTTGVLALCVWLAGAATAKIGSDREIERFAELQAAVRMPGEPPDQQLWSLQRIRDWNEARKHDAAAPLAVLRIPRLNVTVPVLPGTGEWALSRGAGHIEGTAIPGADGNSGIAGHRDSYFRRLKDIAERDELWLETLTGAKLYRVERTWIVTPEDVSVLDPTSAPSLTLVTCYPFYFIGSAPKRFIVRAVQYQ